MEPAASPVCTPQKVAIEESTRASSMLMKPFSSMLPPALPYPLRPTPPIPSPAILGTRSKRNAEHHATGAKARKPGSTRRNANGFWRSSATKVSRRVFHSSHGGNERARGSYRAAQIASERLPHSMESTWAARAALRRGFLLLKFKLQQQSGTLAREIRKIERRWTANVTPGDLCFPRGAD
jgi:hypothetical protein